MVYPFDPASHCTYFFGKLYEQFAVGEHYRSISDWYGYPFDRDKFYKRCRGFPLENEINDRYKRIGVSFFHCVRLINISEKIIQIL